MAISQRHSEFFSSDGYLDLTLIPGCMPIELTGANYDLDACGKFPFSGNWDCSFTQFMRSFLQPATSLNFFLASWYSTIGIQEIIVNSDSRRINF